MKINELIKEIREKNGLTIREFAEKVDVTHSFVSKIEAGNRKVSQKFLEKLVKRYPLYEKQLSQAYIEQNLPEDIKDKIKLEGFRKVEGEVGKFKLKIYDFITNKSGKIDMKKYTEEEYPLLTTQGNEIKKNGYVFNIVGDDLKPVFANDDKIVFLKEKFEDWQNLDSRLILVKINDEMYIRKLFFAEGKPFLFSFNDRLYSKIEVNNEVEYIGQLDFQLERNVRKLEFPQEKSEG